MSTPSFSPRTSIFSTTKSRSPASKSGLRYFSNSCVRNSKGVVLTPLIAIGSVLVRLRAISFFQISHQPGQRTVLSQASSTSFSPRVSISVFGYLLYHASTSPIGSGNMSVSGSASLSTSTSLPPTSILVVPDSSDIIPVTVHMALYRNGE